jgi:hypothetical protein
MSKLKQLKLPVVLDEIAEAMQQPEPNWKLVREHDGLTKHSFAVTWLEWGVDGRFKVSSATPAVGRSLLMSPFTPFFTWQTTAVTEITEQRDDYVKFKTTNSTYELFKINNQSGLD